MLRLLVLFILIALTICEIFRDVKPAYKKAAFALLTIMLVFRFGQGTDYFSYHYLYENEVFFRDIGYSLLSFLCRSAGLPYPVFVAVIALICMALLYRFISRYSKYWFFSLLIVYCVYYMSYFESALRQVMALTIMLGLVIPFFTEKKYVGVFLSMLLAVSFHASALVLFFLPLIKEGDEKSDIKFFAYLNTYSTHFLIMVAGVVTIILLLDFKLLVGFMPDFIRNRALSYVSSRPNIFAIINRAIFVVVAYYLALGPKEKIGKNNIFLLKVYLLGFGVYCLLAGADLIASRINVYFRIIEIVLLPNLVYFNMKDAFLRGRKRLASWVGVVLACLVLIYAKECYNVMLQASYNQPSYYNYPYVSVFNPGKILLYRSPDKYGLIYKYTSN